MVAAVLIGMEHFRAIHLTRRGTCGLGLKPGDVEGIGNIAINHFLPRSLPQARAGLFLFELEVCGEIRRLRLASAKAGFPATCPSPKL